MYNHASIVSLLCGIFEVRLVVYHQSTVTVLAQHAILSVPEVPEDSQQADCHPRGHCSKVQPSTACTRSTGAAAIYKY